MAAVRVAGRRQSIEKHSAQRHMQDAGARVAQSVEHTLGKGEVIGSIPIASLPVKGRVEKQKVERRNSTKKTVRNNSTH